MFITDSRDLLETLGYSFECSVEEGVEPSRVNRYFYQIVPCLERLGRESIAYQRLYRHQFRAYNALQKGYNVILSSGTGSGKTEAWITYFLVKALIGGFRALALYPTLALANDQIRRINSYARACGVNVLQLDAPSRDKLVRELGRSGLRREIAVSSLVITNPAFLLQELKRYLVKPSKSLLEQFFSSIDLLVVDELDFYGPRSLALLMAMIEVLTDTSQHKPQIVILTATLANPDELGSYLKEVTGRDYVVIEGRAFHVENRLLVVLGKELKRVWSSLRGYIGGLESRGDVDDLVLKALKDYSVFEKNPYYVTAYLESLGYSVPSIGLDYTEIIGKYLGDDGVTLVFTKSIAKAEEVVKRLRNKYPGYRDRIASHHHLVPKKVREEIEESARKGVVKIIVSPRTLTQGIDIGTVVRIVHLGLPEDVREFKQREGRKGRRPVIPFTESIIIPSSRWDWELLSKGVDALHKWLKLPLEKTIVNPGNKYIKLFTGLAKIVSPWYRRELSSVEEEVLSITGVLKKDGVNRERLKRVWDRLGFYEYAPPYGIKRYLESGSSVKPLESIGHCDLVEKFQIGCIDYSNDSMIVGHKTLYHGRIVTAVYEKPLREVRFWEDEAFAEAYEEYVEIKMKWGEEPSLFKDLMRGKIFTEVYCVVYPPLKGFGRYIKVPNRVLWIVSSEKPRVYRVGGRHIVSYDRRPIYVSTPVHGEYRDYTYGYLYEVDERLDSSLLRLGLAYVMVVLRRVYGVAFDTIVYGVETVGDKKYFEIHEPESAGLIDSIDWLEVRKAVEEYKPDELDLILLNQVDEIAYSDLLALGVEWSVVRDYALHILDYMLLSKKLVLEIAGELETIPRPSRALKIMSIDGIVESIDRGDVFSLPMLLISIAVFDGEEIYTYTDLVPNVPGVKPRQGLRDVENFVDENVYYSGFKIVYPSKLFIESIAKTGLRKLPLLLKDYGVELSSVISVKGFDKLSFVDTVGIVRRVYSGLESVPRIDRIHYIVSRIRESGYTKLLDSEKSVLERYVGYRVVLNYLLYLLASRE